MRWSWLLIGLLSAGCSQPRPEAVLPVSPPSIAVQTAISPRTHEVSSQAPARPPAATTEPTVGQERVTPAAASAPSDREIARILMTSSRTSYAGSCPCPDDYDRAGRRCGGRSAYSRPGGFAPLCYEADVSPDMIADFRRKLVTASR